MAPDTPIILCPLRFEQAIIDDASFGDDVATHCCGPGAAGIRRWASTIEGKPIVLLAGVGGALTDQLTPGDAYIISRVVTPDGDSYRPTETDGGDVTLVTAEETINEPQARRDLATATGAQLVDLEAATLGEIAQQRGWRWGVVRGVSDGPDAILPDDIDQWIDEEGRTRTAAVVRALVPRPSLVPHVRRLRKASLQAMNAVVSRLRDLF